MRVSLFATEGLAAARGSIFNIQQEIFNGQRNPVSLAAFSISATEWLCEEAAGGQAPWRIRQAWHVALLRACMGRAAKIRNFHTVENFFHAVENAWRGASRSDDEPERSPRLCASAGERFGVRDKRRGAADFRAEAQRRGGAFAEPCSGTQAGRKNGSDWKTDRDSPTDAFGGPRIENGSVSQMDIFAEPCGATKIPIL
jgi:hypothetical protein